MPPTPTLRGSVRPAAVVNNAIRRLWADPRVRLAAQQRAEYGRLLEEWAAAVRAEVVTAA